MSKNSKSTVLQTYMPQQLSEAEIASAIAEAIAATGAAGPQDMGKVMGVVKPKLAGRADMGKVSGLDKSAAHQIDNIRSW